jgi:anti-anti-sigma factor
MPAKNFNVRQDKQGVYHFKGELSIHELDELKGFLEKSLKSGRDIAISLAKVRFIDIAALQLLIAFKKEWEPEAKFLISDVSAEIEDILSLSGLKMVLL